MARHEITGTTRPARHTHDLRKPQLWKTQSSALKRRAGNAAEAAAAEITGFKMM